ncbi:MAG TPA: hypothetical protein VHN14_34180, partial [Kofleriaceae bacterium]|nr:hypothetical protein [Kofleriaceae bacterium]
MAKYVREEGEVEILKELVEGVRDGRRVPGILIITDRRVVLQVPKKTPALRWLLGPALSRMAAPLEMTHQIDRGDFAAVEAGRRRMMSFHNKGDGYGHISFAVYSQTSFEVWQQRMHQWAAGTLSAAPIPTAKLVE